MNRYKWMKQLSGLLRARFPYIYITTWEELRAVETLQALGIDQEIIKTTRKVITWTATEGFKDEYGYIIGDGMNASKSIDFIRNYNEHTIFIMKDFHMYFGVGNQTKDWNVVRKLRDIIPELTMGPYLKNVVFIAPTLVIPEEMQKEISVFDFPLPTVDEITDSLNRMIEENSRIDYALQEGEKEVLAKAALGLTLQEAENAFARAIVHDGRLSITDLEIIMDEKNQVIKKTGILEFINNDIHIDDIGGLENLKRWLMKRNNTWLDAARKYNIPSPKGVLITGVPGCGKSLTAKAMSAMWHLPLLKLDMGKIFSSLVGSSEENMRRAIKTAEAVAPSILWIDEIEKGLGGIGNGGDSGTTTRIFGTFLTWMQDKTAPVFVVATANNIGGLPPELLRKGRFDEIFFVDLPTFEERKQIFTLHLRKRLKDSFVAKEILAAGDIDPVLLERLADMTEGFVGAELEQIVISALYEAYFEDRELRATDLFTVTENMVPLSVTQSEQIKELRDWANVRAVAATARKDMENYENPGRVFDPFQNHAPGQGSQNPPNSGISSDKPYLEGASGVPDDIGSSRGGRTIDF